MRTHCKYGHEFSGTNLYVHPKSGKRHCKTCRGARQRRGEYGISLEQYNEMFTSQNGCCAVCGVHQSVLKQSLSVDHCHETDVIRALLCGDCNRGLGLFKDNPDLLEAAAAYLKQHQPK